MKTEAFNFIKNELRDYDLQSVADTAEVNVQTLEHWLDGKFCPRYTNLVKVANVLGYGITLQIKKL